MAQFRGVSLYFPTSGTHTDKTDNRKIAWNESIFEVRPVRHIRDFRKTMIQLFVFSITQLSKKLHENDDLNLNLLITFCLQPFDFQNC